MTSLLQSEVTSVAEGIPTAIAYIPEVHPNREKSESNKSHHGKIQRHEKVSYPYRALLHEHGGRSWTCHILRRVCI